MPHLIVTGPESTGKSTLARALAEHLDGVFVPEYPRGYLEALDRRAVPDDFRHFVTAEANLLRAAKRQLKRRGRSLKRGGTIVQDTSGEVLRLWYEDKFGPCPTYLAEAVAIQRANIYLMCRPDLQWEYDPLREDPHRRGELFTQLRDIVGASGAPIVEVRGADDSRLTHALEALRRMGIE